MIVCIDGPAGAGKSTAARALAKRLGFRFLDTGAMYRAVALAAVRAKLPWDNPERLAELARRLRIDVREDRVLLDGEDVTIAIRTPEITTVTHYAADNPAVRGHLVELQRAAAQGLNVVTEGRDQGTVVFPHAECKIFLTASSEERARRRLADFARRGQQTTLQEVLAQQNLRDQRDSVRKVGPLVCAADAVTLSTDGLTCQQVVDRLEVIARERQRTES
jgi:cytidylate kinase